MKKFKRVLALLTAAVLVMSMGMGAMANEQPVKRTIELSGGKAGHTYTLYQILKGDTTETSRELVNIQWGDDAPASLKSQYDTAAAAAEAIADENDARTFAQSLTDLSGGVDLVLTEDGPVKFEDLEEGYYIIRDTNNNEDPAEDDYTSAFVVKVVADVTGEMKGAVPSSNKKVADINDSSDHAVGSYQDSADYDIGDAVPFQLNATTASNASDFKKYHITFQDKLSSAFDDPTEYTVTVLGETFTLGTSGTKTTEAGTKITVEMGTAAADQTFAITVTFEPTETGAYLDNECDSTDISVTYTAVLNDDAVIGSAGNLNESYITYSSNPEDFTGEEEGKTPVDKVKVFTYELTIDKIDELGAALKGADFALYKQVNAIDGHYPEGAVSGADIPFAEGVEHSKISATRYYVLVENKTGTSAGSSFAFNGIDDGIYVLVETTIPAGYNPLDSVEFTVTADHDAESQDPKLNSLTATAPFNASENWAVVSEVDKKDGTKHTTVSGEMYAEIENNSGSTLPETGGIGTTIFYIIGGILVIGAGVLLVSRRRMK